MATEEQDFTASSLATAAGVTFGYICQLCRSGKLACRKLGNYWIISHDVGAAWLAEREAKRAQAADEL